MKSKDEENNNDLDFGMGKDPVEEICPVISLFMTDKPFGMLWTDEEIDYLLKERGYKILTRKDSEGNEYTVAVKPGESFIPEEDNCYDTFQKEIKAIILEKLLG